MGAILIISYNKREVKENLMWNFSQAASPPETLCHAKERSFTLFYAGVAGSVRAAYTELRLYMRKRALRAAQLRCVRRASAAKKLRVPGATRGAAVA